MITYTSPDTGITYDVKTVDEYTDRCWLCNGTGTERYETEADAAINTKAFDLWCDQDDDVEQPEEIRTGERPCDRCKGTGKVAKEVGGVRVIMSAHFNMVMNPTP